MAERLGSGLMAACDGDDKVANFFANVIQVATSL